MELKTLILVMGTGLGKILPPDGLVVGEHLFPDQHSGTQHGVLGSSKLDFSSAWSSNLDSVCLFHGSGLPRPSGRNLMSHKLQGSRSNFTFSGNFHASLDYFARSRHGNLADGLPPLSVSGLRRIAFTLRCSQILFQVRDGGCGPSSFQVQL